jgi:putative hydrolase
VAPISSADVADGLKRIAYRLEMDPERRHQARAFSRAARMIKDVPASELEARLQKGTLTELPGVGKAIAGVIADLLQGKEPEYAEKLPAIPERGTMLTTEAAAILQALKGDCHVHSDWSDGGAPIEDMAMAAMTLGHEYMILTDHSPTLKIARGLDADRLLAQLDVVRGLNETLAPFRILTGIEVDILSDGSLDQDPALLAELDVVVASVHSLLRQPSSGLTPRLLTAISDPNMDILGHCTGRIITGRGRPQSTFDAEAVFAACADHGVAVEINSRPERLDPPDDLMAVAMAAGCRFSIDSDAHTPGQLAWQDNGAEIAARNGLTADRIIDTLSVDALLALVNDRASS